MPDQLEPVLIAGLGCYARDKNKEIGFLIRYHTLQLMDSIFSSKSDNPFKFSNNDNDNHFKVRDQVVKLLRICFHKYPILSKMSSDLLLKIIEDNHEIEGSIEIIENLK